MTNDCQNIPLGPVFGILQLGVQGDGFPLKTRWGHPVDSVEFRSVYRASNILDGLRERQMLALANESDSNNPRS
jgi:hypothetical protein